MTRSPLFSASGHKPEPGVPIGQQDTPWVEGDIASPGQAATAPDYLSNIHPQHPPPAPPSEPVEEEADWEESRGYGWLPVWIILSLIALTALGAWSLRSVVGRSLIEQVGRSYHNVSLLPSPQINQAAPDFRLQVFYIADGRTLTPQVRRLRREAGGIERIHLAMEELASPPSGGLLQSPLPPGTKVLGTYLLEGVVWVDLSAEFLRTELRSPLRERLAIYAIVNSLMLNYPSLQGVRFMVNGTPIDTAWGWLDLSTPLGPDLSLVQ